MSMRFRRFFVIPACLLVAAPVVIFSLNAEVDHESSIPTAFNPVSFEESAKLTGWSNLGFCGIAKEFSRSTSIFPLLLSDQPDYRTGRFIWSFRGLVARHPDNWRFDQVIARHEIELKSDQDEMMNVRLAAEAIDYSVIMPGETFSFNNEVGIRSEEKGYKPGLMFEQGKVVRGVGGGICIVSTALYDAALKGGLKIIERHPHSGIPRYADPGFDAAVVYGLSDVKVKNDTPRPILIRATIKGDTLAVTLLGRKTPGVKVELATEDNTEIPYKIIEKLDPEVPQGEVEVKQPAKPGYEVTTVREFTSKGNVIKREVIDHSRYAPRDKIVLVPLPGESSVESGESRGKEDRSPAASFPSTASGEAQPQPPSEHQPACPE